MAQLEALEGRGVPDAVVACVGGGSNAIGLFAPYAYLPVRGAPPAHRGGGGGPRPRQRAHAASISAGRRGVLHGALMYLLSRRRRADLARPQRLGRPGLPGRRTRALLLGRRGLGEYVAVDDDSPLSAFRRVAELEGIIPALETAHASSRTHRGGCPACPTSHRRQPLGTRRQGRRRGRPPRRSRRRHSRSVRPARRRRRGPAMSVARVRAAFAAARRPVGQRSSRTSPPATPTPSARSPPAACSPATPTCSRSASRTAIRSATVRRSSGPRRRPSRPAPRRERTFDLVRRVRGVERRAARADDLLQPHLRLPGTRAGGRGRLRRRRARGRGRRPDPARPPAGRGRRPDRRRPRRRPRDRLPGRADLHRRPARS
jgi:hypothetical protein